MLKERRKDLILRLLSQNFSSIIISYPNYIWANEKSKSEESLLDFVKYFIFAKEPIHLSMNDMDGLEKEDDYLFIKKKILGE